MALKTFNVDEKVYKEFSRHCKHHGISMSRRVERFLQEEMEKIKNNGIKPETAKREIAVGKIETKKLEEHPLSKYC
jgi:negative regulator of replication initiation